MPLERKSFAQITTRKWRNRDRYMFIREAIEQAREDLQQVIKTIQ